MYEQTYKGLPGVREDISLVARTHGAAQLLENTRVEDGEG
jgi:hypothetical protein